MKRSGVAVSSILAKPLPWPPIPDYSPSENCNSLRGIRLFFPCLATVFAALFRRLRADSGSDVMNWCSDCAAGQRAAKACFVGEEALNGPRFLSGGVLRMWLKDNGRHDWTRTSDLYRVNFEVNNLKPFACLAFPQTAYLKTPRKQPIFGDELVTSFCRPTSRTCIFCKNDFGTWRGTLPARGTAPHVTVNRKEIFSA